MNKLVSIITPCYNSESFIVETIKSVISQTYTEWEMLIVDDCSTDNSAEIIKEYSAKDSRIKYLRTDRPSGSPVLPRNKAIEAAKGEFIAFLDSDDIWLPNKIKEQIDLFKSKDVAVVYSNYEKISEKGIKNHRYVIAPTEIDYKNLLKSNVIGNLTGVYDVSKVGKVYCQNIKHEDYVLWLSILKKGYIAKNTNTINALYRVRNNSVSSNKLKILSWQWNILRNVEKQNFLKALYYYSIYAVKAFNKAIK